MRLVLALFVTCQGERAPVHDTQILWARGAHHLVADTTVRETLFDPVTEYVITLDGETWFAGTVETVTHARDGRIRVLGVGTPQRVPELPDSPAIGEILPGYVATNWYALFAPRGLPDGIATRLQAELAKAREDPALKEKAAAVGITMILTGADVLRARIAGEVPRWKQIIPEIGLKIE